MDKYSTLCMPTVSSSLKWKRERSSLTVHQFFKHAVVYISLYIKFLLLYTTKIILEYIKLLYTT